MLDTALESKSLGLLTVSLPLQGSNDLGGIENPEVQKLGMLERVVLMRRCIS